ncbi:MAG: hypothetical protein HY927_07060 [Elusimicrobia bacterium]|nr:hypothetical protein [Elusimicrobiota bacterium]
MTRLAAALLAFSPWAWGAAPGRKPAAPEEAVVSNPSFEFRLPKGWRPAPTEDGSALVLGQAASDGASTFVSVSHFPEGGGEYKDAAAYLARYQGPRPVKAASTKTGPVKACRVGRRPAKGFTEDSVEFIPPRSTDTKKVPVREEHVVLEHGRGFYVLVFHASSADFAKRRPAFQRILDSFQPK